MAGDRSVFDVVGPIMIGPSSSHTAGAVRLGELARAVLGSTPVLAEITLHGSFATTGRGHGTDVALIAGLLGFTPDDERIADSFALAEQQGLSFTIHPGDLGEVHPNTALLALTDAEGATVSVRGSSIGGAQVVVDRLNSYEVELSGDYPVLIVGHLDQPGQVSRISGMLAEADVNIARMRVARERKGAKAIMLLETDTEVDRTTMMRILRLPNVLDVRRIPRV